MAAGWGWAVSPAFSRQQGQRASGCLREERPVPVPLSPHPPLPERELTPRPSLAKSGCLSASFLLQIS